MSIDYTPEDFKKLAIILDKYDTILKPNWIGLINEELELFIIEYAVDFIITCFFMAYQPKDIEKHELKTHILNVPLLEITENTSVISFKKPEEVLGLFSNWRLSINK